MAQCRIIESPVSKEQVKSELWNSLFTRVLNVDKADELYDKTQSSDFIGRFGDWRNNSYIMTTNKIGEPVINDTISNYLKLDTAKNDSSLESKVKDFIANTGFTLSYDELINELNSPVAVVDFFNKTIKINDGKANASTLSEEAFHIYIKVLKQEQSPLYKSLLNDILDKPEYDTIRDEYREAYADDYEKYNEEIIAKVLTERLLNKNTFGEQQDRRIDSWINKVIKFMKGLIGVSSEQFNDSFDLAVDDFLGRTDKVYELDKIDTKMYQLSNTGVNDIQKTIVDKIMGEKLALNKDSTKYVDARTGEELPRVHELVEASKPANLDANFTDDQKAKAKAASEYGTLGHNDITNIIERKLQKIAGVSQDNLIPKSNNLKPAIYGQLENYFDKWVADKLKIDDKGVFILEKPIRDSKHAGTFDLIFIESDGTVHIHDWKFVGYDVAEDGTVKSDGVKQGRRNEWYIQMQKYKEMLSKRYGVKKFAETRFKPIASFYDKNSKGEYELTKIEIGDDAVYLKDIPLETEDTGNRNLNNLIKASLANRDKLTKNRTFPTKELYDAARAEANTITNYVLKLQRDRDNQALIKYIEGKIGTFNKMIYGEEFNDEFANVIDFVNFFEIVQKYYTNEIKDDELDIRNQFASLASNINQLKVAYYNKVADFQKQANINETNHTVGWLEGKTVMLHQFKNDVFRYFNGLKERAFNVIDRNITDFNTEVKQLIEQAKKEGYDFNTITQETKTGYSLVSQFKKEFFDQIKDADVNWLKDNVELVKTIIDKDGKEVNAKEYFDKEREEFVNSESLKLLSDNDKERVIRNWNYKYNVFADEFKVEAMKYYKTKGYHKYLKPIDSWKNDKYVWLENNQDKAITKLYNKFVDINKRANLISDKHIRSNFLPMIEKDTIESLRTNGVSIDNLRKDFFEDLKYIENDEQRLIIKYTHKLDKKDISLDLGTVFSKFAYNVFYNEQFTKLENKGKILQNILQTGTYYKKNGDGSVAYENGSPVVVDYNTGDNTVKSDIQNTVGTFTDFLDKYLRGIDNKSKDINVFGLSGNKILGKLQSYYSATALTLSPISAAVNLTGGMSNLHIIATKGKFFDNTQVLRATADITRFNKTAIQLAKFFDVTSTNGQFTKANDLTQEKIKFDNEWKYILQRKGEGFVQNSTLLAYLQNIDIVNGEIKKSENGNSLYTKLIKSDGTIDLSLINETQYDNIRSKVRALNNEIMGSMTERDFVTAQQYLGGRLLLHFRRWALPMTKARLGGLTYNSNLEEYEEGRYRQAAKLFITGHAIPETLGILKDAITLNFHGESKGLEVLYERALAKNPDIDMDLEEFKEFYLRNLRATMGEIGIILGLLALVMALEPDEDDMEDNNIKALASKIIGRTSQELLFWTDYDSAKRIISAPVPILGLLDKANRIFDETGKMLTGEDNDLGYRLMRLTPINPIISIEKQLEAQTND